MTLAAQSQSARFSRMPQEPEIESGEDQDDADIRDQPFPQSAAEERDIDTDDDGYHPCRVQQAD
jgi:hypothetical protein